MILDRARALLARGAEQTAGEDGGCAVLGITGAPGAGKTTLALALLARLQEEAPGRVAHVPMDGFHLADAELARRGLRERKGAPETFDAAGYSALLERIRRARVTGETVYAPAFDREIEQPVAGSIPVGPEVDLVISEGNYLLLPEEPWTGVRELFDEVWWVDVDDEVRERRLIARHVRFGKDSAHAERFVREVDGVNAQRVAAGRAVADLVVPGDAAGSLAVRPACPAGPR